MLYKMAKDPDKVFCGEMVAEALQNLGILKKDRVPAWHVPGDFYLPKNRIHMEDGYEYKTTYFFRFPGETVRQFINKVTIGKSINL